MTQPILIGAQSNDHSSRLAGIPARRFFTEAETFTRVQLLVSEYYGFDAPINFWDVYNIEAEALGQRVVHYPDGIPDADRTRPLIAEPADLDRLRPPDPHKSARMPWVLEVNQRYLEATGSLDRVFFTAPFSLAVNIRGYENLVMDMMLRPEFAHRLFTFLCDEVLVPFITVMRDEIGNPGILLDGRDAWASPPMISLDMMDEYVVAYNDRLRSHFGPNLVSRGNWGDAKSGDPERFFAQKVRCAPGGLSVLDPDLFEVGPERVATYARAHDLFVTAGVDAALLQEGPVEAIVDRIRLYLHHLGREGKCFIHLNQIPVETPPVHIHAAVAAVKTLGRQPMPENLDEIRVEIPERESFEDFLVGKGLKPGL